MSRLAVLSIEVVEPSRNCGVGVTGWSSSGLTADDSGVVTGAGPRFGCANLVRGLLLLWPIRHRLISTDRLGASGRSGYACRGPGLRVNLSVTMLATVLKHFFPSSRRWPGFAGIYYAIGSTSPKTLQRTGDRSPFLGPTLWAGYRFCRGSGWWDPQNVDWRGDDAVFKMKGGLAGVEHEACVGRVGASVS